MISQKQKMKMQQKLTPQQLMLMRLLQLPVTQLEQKIKEEVEKNPLLDVETSADDNYTADTNDDITDTNDSAADDDFHGIDMDDYYDDDYSYRERLERDYNREERRFEVSESESFTESLIRQLELRNLNDRQRRIAMEIIGSIDGTGYLGRDIQLIANDLAFRYDMDVTDEELEEVLHDIQQFDPAGVGASNLQECLSLQLHRIENPDERTLQATLVVDKYFNQLSSKHYTALKNLLKIDDTALREVLSVIRRLNPKPGWGREEERHGAPYIIPDFIVVRDGDRLSFSLSDRNRPKLRMNSEYTEMLQQLSQQTRLNSSDRETLQFIKSKSDDAQWLIDTLQQREVTLSNTMSAIVDYQRDYFMSGDTADLRPMRLKDIAAKTGYDESTISRVANEKYVQTDFGTFLLKELFSKAVVTDEGEVLAVEHIKEALQQAIDNEDKRTPLTDEALTQQLQAQGFKLSRRTVTKYRESMDIPVGRLRKEVKGDD
jgi:RNA polymerase sigma-54 factor